MKIIINTYSNIIRKLKFTQSIFNTNLCLYCKTILLTLSLLFFGGISEIQADSSAPTSVEVVSYDADADELTLEICWYWTEEDQKVVTFAVFADLNGDGVTPDFDNEPSEWGTTDPEFNSVDLANNPFLAPMVPSDEFLGQIASSNINGCSGSDDTDSGISATALDDQNLDSDLPIVLFPYGVQSAVDVATTSDMPENGDVGGCFTVVYKNVPVVPASFCVILYDVHITTPCDETSPLTSLGCIDDFTGNHGIISAGDDYNGDNSVENGPGGDDVACGDVRTSAVLVDLSLTKTVSDAMPSDGAVVTYTIAVTNEGLTDVTDVDVTDVLPTGLSYESMSIGGPMSNGTTDDTGAPTLLWEGLTIPAGQTINLIFQAAVSGPGIITNSAEITGMDPDLEDIDSTPDNNNAFEDDQDAICLTVVGQICDGQSFTLTAEDGFNYQWFEDGDEIDGATNQTLVVTMPGTYSYTALYGDDCPIVSECPIILTDEGCCTDPMANAGPDQDLCNMTTTTLNGSTDVGTGSWSTTSSATVTSGGAVSGMTAGNCYIFLWSVVNGTCSGSDDVEVCVDTQPTANAGADQDLCNATSATVTGLPTGGMWSTTTSASITNGGAISGMVAGNCYVFTYSVVNGECSDTDDVEVCTDSQPTANAGADQDLCNATSATVSGLPAGGMWSTTTSASITNGGAISGMVAGNCYVFTYSVVNGECSDTDDVEVCTDSQPTANAGADQDLCNATSASVSGLPAGGTWSTTSSASISTAGSITNMVPGNCYVFTYSVVNGECSDTDDVEVCVDTQPSANAGNDQDLCNVTTAAVSGLPAGGSWSTSTSALITNGGSISNMVPGNCYVFTYSVVNGTCSDTDDVEVCVDTQPSANAGSDQDLCNVATTTLGGMPTGGTWSTATNASVTNGGDVGGMVAGNCYVFTYSVVNGECSDTDDVEVCVDTQPAAMAGNDQDLCNATTSTVTGMPTGGNWSTLTTASVDNAGAISNMVPGNCYVFTYTIDNGTCTSSDNVEVCVDEQPVAVAGNDISLCNVMTTTLVGSPTGGTWGAIAGSNTFVDDDGVVTGMIMGNCYTFIYFVENGQCESQDDIEVCVDSQPNVFAGDDQAICNETTASLNGATPTGGMWSALNGASVTDGGVVSNMVAGNCYQFRYSVVDGTCSGQDDVEICVDAQPTATAGDDQDLCNVETTTLMGNQDLGSGTWSTLSAASVNNSGEVSGLVADNCYVFTYTVVNGTCSDTDDIEVCVDGQPTAMAGTDQSLCNVETASLMGMPSNGTWSTVSAEAMVDASSGDVSGMVAGNCYLFTYSITNGECSDTDDVEICVDAQPDALAGDDQALCNVEATSLSGMPAGGTWSTSSAEAMVDESSGAVTGMLAGNCYVFTYSVVNGECSDTDDVEVCVDELPAPNAGDDQTLCNSTSVDLMGTTDVGVGMWSSLSAATVDPISGSVSDMVPDNCYVFTYTVTNGECTASDDVEICVDDQPMDVSAGDDQDLCNVTTTTLNGSSSTGTGVWSSMNNAVSIDPDNGTVTDMEPGNCYVFVYSVANGTCDGSDNVMVCVFEQPEVNAGDDVELCGETTYNLMGSTSAGSGTWSSNLGGINLNTVTGEVSGMTVGLCYEFTYGVINGACTASDVVEVCVNIPATLDLDAEFPQVCQFDPVNLTATSNNGGTWSTSNGAGSFSPSATSPMVEYIPETADLNTTLEFVWTGDDPDGDGPCDGITEMVTVFLSEAPTLEIVGGDGSFCAPDPDSLSIYPGIPLEVILGGSAGNGVWTGGLGTINFPTSPNQATYIPDPSEVNTTVTLTWTSEDPDGLGPCDEISESVDLFIEDSEIVGEIIVVNSSSCGLLGEDCNGSITFTLLSGPAPGFYEIRFIFGTTDTTAMVSGMAGIPATVTLEDLCTGGYFIVSVTPPDGCTDIINRFVTIEDPDAPPAPAPTGSMSFCLGEDVQLFANIDLPPGSYFWQGPNGFTSFDQNPIIPNADLDNVGQYTLEITVDGCKSEPGVYDLTLENNPSVFATELTVCADSPSSNMGTFDLSEANDFIQGMMGGSAGISYYLTEMNAMNGIDPLSSPYQSVNNTIYATVISENGCSSITTIDLIVQDFTSLGDVEINRVCMGNHLYVEDPNNAPNPFEESAFLVYYWYLDGELVDVINGIPYYSPSETGVYSVEIWDTESGNCNIYTSGEPFVIEDLVDCFDCGN